MYRCVHYNYYNIIFICSYHINVFYLGTIYYMERQYNIKAYIFMLIYEFIYISIYDIYVLSITIQCIIAVLIVWVNKLLVQTIFINCAYYIIIFIFICISYLVYCYPYNIQSKTEDRQSKFEYQTWIILIGHIVIYVWYVLLPNDEPRGQCDFEDIQCIYVWIYVYMY